ncbi:hypothetical protein SAMN05192539_1002155 [Paraburkholderia diazotrophica]|uniref:Uncharacterized protein n=1 Tax=Paraburkholderia diazotrophica TaxID=667676 RepID=A0A1H6RM29_9BURK|nr:hypothetical protein SAMN05192539_1002155 [Paraburkholderia diazotrophica]
MQAGRNWGYVKSFLASHLDGAAKSAWAEEDQTIPLMPRGRGKGLSMIFGRPPYNGFAPAHWRDPIKFPTNSASGAPLSG